MKKIVLILLFISLILPGCGAEKKENPGDAIAKPPIDQDEKQDGLQEVFEPSIEHKDLYSVMIDNNPAARPQTGLNQAQRIYELPAEGGVTRFLALFRHESVGKIGPVRSARIDFLDIILPYDSSFAHCGGSKDALARIKRELDKDLCEIYNSSFSFYRDNTRRAPHNLYTSTELLNKGYDRRGFSRESDYKFEHTLKNNFSNITHKGMVLDYFTSRTYNYKISYTYDSSTKKYIRLTNDKPHKLTDAESLQAEGVIFIKSRFNTQANGLVSFQTTGENKAYISYKGQHLETTWKRNSAKDHYKFLVDGNYIEINNPGFIIHIIPHDKNVIFE